MSRAEHPWRRHAFAALLIGLSALATPASAQYADADRVDWKEDPVPPPPAFKTNRLIDIEMPRGASVRMGIDPETITINRQTGIVRYVVVARGTSAVNAFYEGIRCATGEYRVYARQVQGGEWSPADNESWKSMRGQSNVMVQHPDRLARGGLCMGTGTPQSAIDAVRELRSGNRSLYY